MHTIRNVKIEMKHRPEITMYFLAAILTILMPSTLFQTFALAGEGNGGGYGGPDLNPPAIPVAVERALSENEIKKAMSTCMLGSTPRALGGFVAEVYSYTKSVFSDYCDADETTEHTQFIFELTEHIDGKYFSTSSQFQVSCKYVRPASENPNVYSSRAKKNPLGVSVVNGVDEYSIGFSAPGDHFWDSMGGMVLKYDRVTSEGEFDDLGVIIQGSRRFTGLSIQFSKDAQRSNGLLSWYNAKTTHPTAFKSNLKPLVQCLKTELQKVSKQ